MNHKSTPTQSADMMPAREVKSERDRIADAIHRLCSKFPRKRYVEVVAMVMSHTRAGATDRDFLQAALRIERLNALT